MPSSPFADCARRQRAVPSVPVSPQAARWHALGSTVKCYSDMHSALPTPLHETPAAEAQPAPGLLPCSRQRQRRLPHRMSLCGPITVRCQPCCRWGPRFDQLSPVLQPSGPYTQPSQPPLLHHRALSSRAPPSPAGPCCRRGGPSPFLFPPPGSSPPRPLRHLKGSAAPPPAPPPPPRCSWSWPPPPVEWGDQN